MYGPNQEELLIAFGYEHNNFRAALTWGLATPTASPSIATRTAWLTVHLARFWELRSHWQEGREWLAKALLFIETQTQVSQANNSVAETGKIELLAGLLLLVGASPRSFLLPKG